MTDTNRTLPPSAAALSVDQQDALSRAADLMAVAGWVERARQQLDELARAAEIDAELRARLEQYRIHHQGPAWEDEESEGLLTMHVIVEAAMRDAVQSPAAAAARAEVAHG